jgi:hypothetical protein
VKFMMTACPSPSAGRLPAGRSAAAGSWVPREHAITGYVYGK